MVDVLDLFLLVLVLAVFVFVVVVVVVCEYGCAGLSIGNACISGNYGVCCTGVANEVLSRMMWTGSLGTMVVPL